MDHGIGDPRSLTTNSFFLGTDWQLAGLSTCQQVQGHAPASGASTDGSFDIHHAGFYTWRPGKVMGRRKR